MKLAKLWWCFLILVHACTDNQEIPPKTKVPVNRPPKNTEFISEKSGDFSFERSADGTTTRFKYKDRVLSRGTFVEELTSPDEQGQLFREFFNKSVATLDLKGGNGIALKTPIYNQSTANLPFYYVAIPESFAEGIDDNFKDYFYHCEPRPLGSLNTTADFKKNYRQTFGFSNSQFFVHKPGDIDKSIANGAVLFNSSGASATPLISPCPFSSDSQNDHSLGHLYAYAKKLADDNTSKDYNRIQSLWYAAGIAIKANMDAGKSTYFSTEGKAVKYLHLRAQTNTNFYGEDVKELMVGDKSLEFYQKKFPE